MVRRVDVLAAYCYQYPALGPGDWLKDRILTGMKPFFCQSQDPTASGYFAPPLTEAELTAYFSGMAQLKSCGS